jgi:dimethylamine monooxygenase subunit B
MTGAPTLSVRVDKTDLLTPDIRLIRLVSTTGAPLPLFSGGAHIVVSLATPQGTIRNPYSLTSAPDDGTAYEICVQKSGASRGGSLFIHQGLSEGDELEISPPVNLFAMDRRARKHLFIAGGIGITPFVSMMRQLDREGGTFELHYATRSADSGAFRQALVKTYGAHRVSNYCSTDGNRLDLPTVLESQPLGTQLYVCGPDRLINAVLQEAREAGWPDESVHCEHFAAPPPGSPFTVELARQGRSLPVAAQQSVLEAIEAAGLSAPSLCRGGACGQCETGVVSCDGALEHHDHYLSPAQRVAGDTIMICVSRIVGERLVLDL